jgi:hypothetical protein
MCKEIDECELSLSLSELLDDLWPKMYTSVGAEVKAKVLQTFSDYYSKTDRNDLPWGSTLEHVSSVEYWKNYVRVLDQRMRTAGDFALRLVTCGVTECGVERVFSHIHWLVGVKRFKLGEQSLQDLARLKFSEKKLR